MADGKQINFSFLPLTEIKCGVNKYIELDMLLLNILATSLISSIEFLSKKVTNPVDLMTRLVFRVLCTVDEE